MLRFLFSLSFVYLLVPPISFVGPNVPLKLGECIRNSKNIDHFEQEKIPKGVKDWQPLEIINTPNKTYSARAAAFTITAGPECQGNN